MSATEPDEKSFTQHGVAMSEYRSWLIASEQKSQESFDKAVMTLSGGALGVSFIFLKDVVGDGPVQSHYLLLISWILWGLSVTCTLASFYCSHLSLRIAIRQVDEGRIHQKPAGGVFARITEVLNCGGAILFFAGVCFIAAFAHSNLQTRGDLHVIQATFTAATPVHSTSSTAPPISPAAAGAESRLHPATTTAPTGEEVKLN